MSTIDDLMDNTEGKIVAFDLDLTLTLRGDKAPDFMNTSPNEFNKILMEARPNYKAIGILNYFAERNHIRIYTQRGEYASEVTHKWLKKHNVHYDDIIFRKARYDIFFDDRAYNGDKLNGEKNE